MSHDVIVASAEKIPIPPPYPCPSQKMMLQPWMSGSAPFTMLTPPPITVPPLAAHPEITQYSMVGEAPSTRIPPPPFRSTAASYAYPPMMPMAPTRDARVSPEWKWKARCGWSTSPSQSI